MTPICFWNKLPLVQKVSSDLVTASGRPGLPTGAGGDDDDEPGSAVRERQMAKLKEVLAVIGTAPEEGTI